MNDDQAEAVALAVLTLAVTVRDEGPAAVAHAAAEVLAAAGGDATAALIAAAALINVEQPITAWWQAPEPAAVVVHPDIHAARRSASRVRDVPLDPTRPMASYYGPADPSVIRELIADLFPKVPAPTRSRDWHGRWTAA